MGPDFGTPVPGYEAPQDTVEYYTRVATALVRPLVSAHESGQLNAPEGQSPVSDALRDAVAPVSAGLLPGLPVETVVRLLEAWATIVGSISLELFGHWNKTVLDPSLLFQATVDQVAETIGLS
jgi:hypothetical protein